VTIRLIEVDQHPKIGSGAIRLAGCLST
jgi:hypothetical protein